jgi:hypothetical protein
MWANKAGIGFSFIATPFPNAGLITERKLRSTSHPDHGCRSTRLLTTLRLSSMEQPSPNGRHNNYERTFCPNGNLNIDHSMRLFELADYSGGEECSLDLA